MLSLSPNILNQRINLYFAALSEDSSGGPQYTTDTPDITNVPCSIQPREVDELIDDQGRVTQVQWYHVFFASNPGVTPRDLMTYVDTRGVVRRLFVRATRDEGGRGEIFVVRAIERL